MRARGPRHAHSSLSILCSEQRLQAVLQSSLNAEQQRKAKAQAELKQAIWAMQILREGLEHLAGKLNHLAMGRQGSEEEVPRTTQDLAPQVGCPPHSPIDRNPPPCPIQDIRRPLRRESLPHVPGVTPLLLSGPRLQRRCAASRRTPRGKSHFVPQPKTSAIRLQYWGTPRQEKPHPCLQQSAIASGHPCNGFSLVIFLFPQKKTPPPPHPLSSV